MWSGKNGSWCQNLPLYITVTVFHSTSILPFKKYAIIYGRAHFSNIYLNTKDKQETGKYYDPHRSDLSYIRSWLIDHSSLRLRVVINTSLPPPQAGAPSYQEILFLIADICLQMCQGAGSEIKLNSRKKLFVR